MKKIFALILSAIIFLLTANVLASNYVGNLNSKKFHYSDCYAAQKIKSSNRIEFNSRDEAIGNGYISCKICRP